jgi:hypothetical protein
VLPLVFGPRSAESPRVDLTSNGGCGWCKVVTLFSTRLIPYLSRMTSETEG